MIVAIDGPAGSGKSTTARAVAEEVGYLYLDTGAMYRAVALAFLRAGRPANPEQASLLLPDLRVDVRHEDGHLHVSLNGEDVTEAIRTPEVGRAASRVSALPAVRAKLVEEQRRIGQAADPGVVLEGRDIGTVVFPEAEVKVFMQADPRVRAERRSAELQAKGHDVTVEDVLAEMKDRDARDADREVAPLRQAEDAVVVDTTACSFDEQVDRIVALVRERASD